jgi:predicted Rdx family selenoprotein
MLRAAYFAQELLSTFSTELGEVALQPATGGRFVHILSFDELMQVVTLSTSAEEFVIWDRKEKGGFPGCSLIYLLMTETKVLKQLVRDIIQPGRDLGHSDRKGHKAKTGVSGESNEEQKRLQEMTKQDAQIGQGQAVETGQAIDKDCQDCQ